MVGGPLRVSSGPLLDPWVVRDTKDTRKGPPAASTLPLSLRITRNLYQEHIYE